MNAVELAGLVFGSVVTGLFVVVIGVWAVSQLVEEHRRRSFRGAELASLIADCERDSTRRDEGAPPPRVVGRAGGTSADRTIRDRHPLVGPDDRRPQRRHDRPARPLPEQAR
jgi:hypothetical protein